MSALAAAADARPAAPAVTTGCAHCGAPVSAGGRFCCAGCAAAHELVSRLGLAGYYAHRTPAAAPPAEIPETAASDVGAYVQAEPDGTCSLAAMVDGLRCPACLWLIESALSQEQDVAVARLSYATGRLQLVWHGPVERGAALLDLVRRLGYRAQPYDPAVLTSTTDEEDRALLRALAVAGFAAANIMLLSVAVWAGAAGATRDLLHWVSALIGLPAIAYAGLPFFTSALGALGARRTNMDVPISLGVLLATGMSLAATIGSRPHAYFDSAVTLLFFLLIGRYLERRARGRARTAAEALLALSSAPATRIVADGSSERVMPGALAAGDTILVAAGERVGADGTILSGRSELDRSLIDGETAPAPVAPGDAVHAGMINLAMPVTVAVTATGERTLLAEIARLMEAAERGRTRYVQLADRVARAYAPVVHLLALATLVGWLLSGQGWEAALTAAIAVLIITCPCALGLAIPAVQVIAADRLMRRGILLKSGTALERLVGIDTVVFDKTGTLTLGRPVLTDEPDEHILAAASALAAASRHPLSRAIRALRPNVAPALNVIEHPGEGLSSAGPEGETRLGRREFCGVPSASTPDERPELWLARPGHPPERLAFDDALRPDAAQTVRQLAAAARHVMLLSGDRPAVVGRCADSVGITEWTAQMTPAEKAARLSGLANAGHRVLMVGDGLNDAPALATAHVAMSPSTAADVSQNAADIVFQSASLGAVGDALALAQKSRILIRENLAFAIVYNAVAVPLAMAGLATPLIAAAAMSLSSLIVILNALRLRLNGAGGRR